jgi:hypothetical protein
MKKKKLYLTVTEWRFLIHSLNALKTKLHSEKQYTDTVDDALIAVMRAKTKMIKVA